MSIAEKIAEQLNEVTDVLGKVANEVDRVSNDITNGLDRLAESLMTASERLVDDEPVDEFEQMFNRISELSKGTGFHNIINQERVRDALRDAPDTLRNILKVWERDFADKQPKAASGAAGGPHLRFDMRTGRRV